MRAAPDGQPFRYIGRKRTLAQWLAEPRPADDSPLDAYPAVQFSPSIALHLFAGHVASIAIQQHTHTMHLAVGESVTWADADARVLAIGSTVRSAELARDLLA